MTKKKRKNNPPVPAESSQKLKPTEEERNKTTSHSEQNESEKHKWKDYLFQFILLFVTITLGFFVENKREEYRDNRKEVKEALQLANSLKNDIKKDIFSLDTAIAFSQLKMSYCDTGIMVLHKSNILHYDTLLYLSSRYIAQIFPYERTSGTYEQLKFTGSLKLFDQSIIDLMNEYDTKARIVQAREDFDKRFINERLFPFQVKQLNAEVISAIRFKQQINSDLYFTNTDLATTREYINYIVFIRNTRRRSVEEYIKLKEKAVELISALEEKYE